MFLPFWNSNECPWAFEIFAFALRFLKFFPFSFWLSCSFFLLSLVLRWCNIAMDITPSNKNNPYLYGKWRVSATITSCCSPSFWEHIETSGERRSQPTKKHLGLRPKYLPFPHPASRVRFSNKSETWAILQTLWSWNEELWHHILHAHPSSRS